MPSLSHRFIYMTASTASELDDFCQFEETELFDSCLIVDDHHGIYVPQVFCQRYKKTDKVSQEDWDICLSGPDHEFYWESWEIILDNWGGEETDQAGNKYQIGIYQDGCLFQTRRLIETA